MFNKYNNKKTFIRNWIVVLLVFVIGASAFAGYNSINGSFDLFAGFGAVGELVGGIASLGAFLVVIIALAIIVSGMLYVAKKDYTGSNGLLAFHVIIGLAVVIIAGFVGFRWIELPEDGWSYLAPVLGTLIFTGIAAAIVTPRKTTVVVNPTATVATPAETTATVTPSE